MAARRSNAVHGRRRSLSSRLRIASSRSRPTISSDSGLPRISRATTAETESVWTRAYHELRRARRNRARRAMRVLAGDDVVRSRPVGARQRLDSASAEAARRPPARHGRARLPDAAERRSRASPPATCTVRALIFEQAAAIGDRFADDDLRALARQGRGRALTRLGRIQEGVALFDEAMVAVMANEVSPIVAGVVVLQRDRGLLRNLRSETRAGMDGGARTLVRRSAGADAVPRSLPGATI